MANFTASSKPSSALANYNQGVGKIDEERAKRDSKAQTVAW